MKPRYVFTQSDGGVYSGIQVQETGEVLEVSEDSEYVRQIVELLNQNDVDLCHLKDVIHDLLYEKYVLL